MASNSVLLDSFPRGKYVGRERVSYPFLALGDSSARVILRDWRVRAAQFQPGQLGVERDPVFSLAYLMDQGEPLPTGLGDVLSAQRTFATIPGTQRDPASIVVNKPNLPSGSALPRAIGDYAVFQPDTSLVRYDAYYRQTVTSDSGAPAFYPTGGTYTLTFDGDTTGALNYNDSSGTVQTALNALASVTDRGGLTVSGSYNSAGGLVVTFNSYATATIDPSLITTSGGAVSSVVGPTNSGYTQSPQISAAAFQTITGGTFTLTIFGQTTAAIAYNATAATVQSALNALSEVSGRGNCTVTVPSGQTTILAAASEAINFTINFTNDVLTASSSSLTPAGSTATPSITDGTVGRTQKILFASSSAVRDIYCAGHGLTTSDTLFILGGSTYYSGIAGAKFSLPDANTIRLVVAPSDSYAAASTITAVGKRTKQNYTPGTVRVRGFRVSTFYLPGVTAGISSAADITLPTSYENETELLLAIFAGNTAINVDVGDLTRWNGWPILTLTVSEVSAADL